LTSNLEPVPLFALRCRSDHAKEIGNSPKIVGQEIISIYNRISIQLVYSNRFYTGVIDLKCLFAILDSLFRLYDRSNFSFFNSFPRS